jgi:hypothetical protein
MVRRLRGRLVGGDTPPEFHPETLGGARVALLGKNGGRENSSGEYKACEFHDTSPVNPLRAAPRLTAPFSTFRARTEAA